MPHMLLAKSAPVAFVGDQSKSMQKLVGWTP